MMNEKIAQQVQDLVDERNQAKRRIAELEEQVGKLKTRVKDLEESSIPDVMFEHGLNGITLFSDVRVDVRPLYFAREDNDNPTPFREWLRDNGFGGLIKVIFEERVSDPYTINLLKTILQDFKISYDLSEGVHWKTLEAWFKEQTEKGIELPLTLFKNYIGRKAYIRS